MSLILKIAIAVAAALFIGVSATMNALFLSSLGQTPAEIGLLISVSIAADVVKAALPVVIGRAIEVRAWAHCTVASVLLAFVTALSLTSGAGFAALTRNGAVATRVAQGDTLTARQAELREIEVSLDRLTQSRAVAVVEAE